jgi:hypothetical protein
MRDAATTVLADGFAARFSRAEARMHDPDQSEARTPSQQSPELRAPMRNATGPLSCYSSTPPPAA